MNLPQCQCGCGHLVRKRNSRRLPGHYIRTEEIRQKQRQKMLGRKLSLETIQKLKGKGHPGWSKGLTKENNPILAEVSRKLSIKLKGENNPNFGNRYKLSEEAIEKIRLANLGKPKPGTSEKLKGRKPTLERLEELKGYLKIARSKVKHRPGPGFKGKTYTEICKDEEKARERANRTRSWMKTEKNIRRFCKHPSKGQQALFEKLKQTYPDATMEYPISTTRDWTIWLDIAIPSSKIDYEYDGEYWHNLNQQRGKRSDTERDKILTNLGWKVIRVKEENK